MTDTIDRSDTEVDLRTPAFSIPADPVERTAPHDTPEVLRHRRRVLTLAGIGLLIMLVLHQIVGVVMADQRQRHLAHEVTSPDKRISPGEASLLLQIPDIGVNVVVAEGASSSELRGGPGRVIGSASLIDGGNVVVLGRKLRFGKPFGRLGELRKGSVIVAQARGGGLTRSYKVTSVRNRQLTDVRPITSTDDRLTLITSGPGILPTTRLVVVAGADAPAPEIDGASGATPLRLDAAALDERSTGVFGLLLSVLVLAGAVFGSVIGIRRLNESYASSTVVQAVLPVVSLIVIVAFIISDSALPTTW